MNKCEKCGFLHYRTDPCRKPKVRIGTEAPDNALATPKSDVSASTPSDVKVHTQSTASRKDVIANGSSDLGEDASSPPQTERVQLPLGQGSKATPQSAGTQALPVDTNSLSPVERSAGPQLESRVQPAPGAVPTPGTKFDKKAWMREYMREHRRGIRRRVAK